MGYVYKALGWIKVEKYNSYIFQIRAAALLFVLTFFPSVLSADTVNTKDGESYYGKIISREGGRTVLEMRIGTMKFHDEEIASIEKAPYDPRYSEPEPKLEPTPAFWGEQDIDTPAGIYPRVRPSQSPEERKALLEKKRKKFKEILENRRKKREEKMKEYKLKRDKLKQEYQIKRRKEIKALQEKKLKERKKAETERKKVETHFTTKEKKTPKEEPRTPGQGTTIKPTIRGLGEGRYKTY